MFFVVISHLNFCPKYLRIYFSPFFLAGFFAASGMVFSTKDNFFTFLMKKVVFILFPWIVFVNVIGWSLTKITLQVRILVSVDMKLYFESYENVNITYNGSGINN